MANPKKDIVIEKNGQTITIEDAKVIDKYYFLHANCGCPQIVIDYNGRVYFQEYDPQLISMYIWDGYAKALDICANTKYPAVIDGAALIEWIQTDEIMDLIAIIVAGYRKTADGVEMTDSASLALDMLESKMANCECHLGENSGVWDASDYFDGVCDYINITADMTDSEIVKLSREETEFHLEDGILLTGMDSFLLWLRDEAREKEIVGEKQ